MKNTITATSYEIQQVWEKLTGGNASTGALCEKRAREWAENGWVHGYEIADNLHILDHRLDFTWLSHMPDIMDRLGLKTEINYRAQWKYADEISGWASYSSSDTLRYFWWLERLGFSLDLGPLSDEIFKTLPQTRYLIESHLDVLLYRAERFSQPPVGLITEGAEHSEAHRIDHFTSKNGVRIEIGYDAGDHAISLVSTAPAYSAPKEEVTTTCEKCGLTYARGRREDDDHHAIHHRQIVEPLEPKPSRAWKAAVEANPESVWVDARSPKWMHVAMYRRARAFQREFRYDFAQWSDLPAANKGGVAFAFLDQDFRMIGGCRFQLGGGRDGRNRLSWIWFCPEARRQGHLSKAWSRLQAQMGDFDLEPPVSDAMQAFMRMREGR